MEGERMGCANEWTTYRLAAPGIEKLAGRCPAGFSLSGSSAHSE